MIAFFVMSWAGDINIKLKTQYKMEQKVANWLHTSADTDDEACCIDEAPLQTNNKSLMNTFFIPNDKQGNW